MSKNIRRWVAVVVGLIVLLGTDVVVTAGMPTVTHLHMENPNSHNMWVTIYEQGVTGRSITHSGCVPAKAKRTWIQLHSGTLHIRAEMTQNSACAHPRICDTTMEVVPKKRNSTEGDFTVKLVHATGTNHCHWQPLQ